MLTQSSDPADQHLVIRELTGEIEVLRRKQQDRWREGGHPEAKRFSQEELTDLVCPSYKNLLLGRTKRLPMRAMILAIADYLECSIHERNDLLLAAQYMPDVVELRADEEQAKLEHARWLLHMLPIPAALLTRGLHVEATNQAMLRINGLPSIEAIPAEQRDGVHWFFEPTLPTYHAHARDDATWHTNALHMVHLFRHMNQPFAREPWYHRSIEQFSMLPGFHTCWDEVAQLPATYGESGVVATYVPDAGRLVRHHNVLITLGPTLFPNIVVSLPFDDAARNAHRHLGFPVHEHRWDYILTGAANHARHQR